MPPETSTPSALMLTALMMELWPMRFWMNLPSGRYHCLMLSDEPLANVALRCRLRLVAHAHHALLGVEGEGADGLLVVGERADALALADVPQPDRVVVRAADHLRCLITAIHCKRRACGSNALASTEATVLVWPVMQCTCALVRMSHSCGR